MAVIDTLFLARRTILDEGNCYGAQRPSYHNAGGWRCCNRETPYSGHIFPQFLQRGRAAAARISRTQARPTFSFADAVGLRSLTARMSARHRAVGCLRGVVLRDLRFQDRPKTAKQPLTRDCRGRDFGSRQAARIELGRMGPPPRSISATSRRCRSTAKLAASIAGASRCNGLAAQF